MQYSLGSIADFVRGRVHGDSNLIIEQIFTDSRKRVNPVGSLFCAIRGQQHDGHHYIAQLASEGFTCFLVEEIPALESQSDLHFIVVKDVLMAVQLFARHHRSNYNIPIVAITGSNGKTIVKEWCYQLLYKTTQIARNPRSYNSQIGVPLSVLQLNFKHELGLFEAGISQVGEMPKLAEIIQPTIGIFTNIGDAHASGFLNETEKIYEKLKLFKNCKELIFRKEDTLLTDILERFCAEKGIKPVTWSDTNNADLTIKDHYTEGNKTIIQLEHNLTTYKLVLPFVDEMSFENAMHALTLAVHLGQPIKSLEGPFSDLQSIEMRLNQKTGINQCTIISDFYNSDLKSIEILLDWADHRHTQKSKTIVLSEIEQTDLSDRDLYTEINTLLNKFHYDRLIGIGPKIAALSFLFDLPKTEFYSSTEAFTEAFSAQAFNNELIVLKGARSFAFERIEKLLQLKVHNTVLEIDLNAMQHNLNFYKSHLKPETKLMVMVKASSYGSGAEEIAHFLQFNKIDYLGVAYADEGVALRKQGIYLPIMVMNADEDSYGLMLEHDLEPELYSMTSLSRFSQAVRSKAIQEARCHIEVNTGMNRLGFETEDVNEVAELLNANPALQVQSVFSHYAASEDETKDALTHAQVHKLNMFYDTLTGYLGYQPMKHIANSAGAIRFPETQFDMVRLGVSLYGHQPVAAVRQHIQPVATLKSFISQIREVDAGKGVGYGFKGIAKQKRKIAVVAIGYADGLNRLLGNGNGFLLIHGKEAPIVGSVCMDMTMCDVTNIDCQEGDEVIIFGKKPTIEELAARIKTIPYEILTSVSQRVKRIYTEE